MTPNLQYPKAGNDGGNGEKGKKYAVALGDCPGGPIDPWCEVEEAEKGHAFDEMWGVRK